MRGEIVLYNPNTVNLTESTIMVPVLSDLRFRGRTPHSPHLKKLTPNACLSADRAIGFTKYILYRLHLPFSFFLAKRERNRKEVIQEQLPLPLPCYDLLFVTDLTVSPQEYMGLQVLPAPLS